MREVTLPMLLDQMIETGATDLHLVHNNPITYRVRKEIMKTDVYIKGQDIFKLLNTGKAINETHISNFHVRKAAGFAIVHRKIRFRGELAKESGEYTCVIRRLSDKALDMDEMGLPDWIKRELQKSQGLILVTGPTGSGKTTTLTSMINFINETRRSHIATVEDPIEYEHKPKMSTITQQEVGRDTPTFAESLRSMLRRDPDVILVGEMRDPETMETACTAAETGHLVFGTTHTNTAISSIDRIVSTFPPLQQQNIRSQIASSLRLIINQRLFPTKDGKGMVPAYEIMVISKEMRKAIRLNELERLEDLMVEEKENGNITMEEAIRNLKDQGVIDEDLIF